VQKGENCDNTRKTEWHQYGHLGTTDGTVFSGRFWGRHRLEKPVHGSFARHASDCATDGFSQDSAISKRHLALQDPFDSVLRPVRMLETLPWLFAGGKLLSKPLMMSTDVSPDAVNRFS
jgi:hypothetical protein